MKNQKVQTYDIYAIETTEGLKEVYIGASIKGYLARYQEHLQEAKHQTTDKAIWMRYHRETIRPVLLEQVQDVHAVNIKELQYILRYFKREYGIINTVNPVTRDDLPLAMLYSIRLPYGLDPLYSEIHDFYEVKLFTREVCNQYIERPDCIELFDSAIIDRLYSRYGID